MVLGIISGTLGIIAIVPYVRDIFRKKARPERATWWIWTVLTLVALSAQLSAGATWSAAMSVGQLAGNITIALLSLRYGYGKFTRRDYAALVAAGMGVAVWQYVGNPIVAIVVAIALDMLGFYLTMIKTWHAPRTETLSTWVMATIASGLAVLIVKDIMNMSQLLYPLYIFIGNGLMWGIIVFRRRRARRKRKR